jgi:hypothetical protein
MTAIMRLQKSDLNLHQGPLVRVSAWERTFTPSDVFGLISSLKPAVALPRL